MKSAPPTHLLHAAAVLLAALTSAACPFVVCVGPMADDARCLPRCGDRVCPTGAACVDGACVPPGTTVMDGGSGDAGATSSSGAAGSSSVAEASSSTGTSSSSAASASLASSAAASSQGVSSSAAPLSSSALDAGVPDGCVPATCNADAGIQCGTLNTGCGAAVECGACGAGLECGLFVENRCDAPDTSPPEARFIRVPPALSRGQNLLVHFTAEDSGGSGVGSWSCALDEGAFMPCAPPVELGEVPEGDHVFSVLPTDLAGNVGDPISTSFRADRTPPACMAAGVAACSAGSTEQMTFTCTDNTAVVTTECAVDSGAFGPCRGETTHGAGSLVAGPHAFFVRARDGVGNTSAVAELRWVTDQQAPTVVFQQVPGLSRTGTANATFRAQELSGCGGLRTTCTLDGVPIAGACTSPLVLQVSEGPHTLCVTAADGAGNAGNACTSWRVDSTPPTLQVPAITTQASTTYDALLAVPFFPSCQDTGGSGCVGVTCTVDGMSAGVTCDLQGGVAEVGGSGPHAFGAHELAVTARDAAGNTTTVRRTFTVERCAGDMQFPRRTSNGFRRGACCVGLSDQLVSESADGGPLFHPRGDGACRPDSDLLGNAREGAWGSNACAAPLDRASNVVGAQGACSARAGIICVERAEEAAAACGYAPDGGVMPAVTPAGGMAGEGINPPPVAGCEVGTSLAGGLMAQRKRNADLCVASPGSGELRDAVDADTPCVDGLVKTCRSNPPAAAAACVCADKNPYALDGRN